MTMTLQEVQQTAVQAYIDLANSWYGYCTFLEGTLKPIPLKEIFELAAPTPVAGNKYIYGYYASFLMAQGLAEVAPSIQRKEYDLAGPGHHYVTISMYSVDFVGLYALTRGEREPARGDRKFEIPYELTTDGLPAPGDEWPQENG